MSETEQLIEQIAAGIASRIKPTIPIDVALWDIKAICEYLHRSENYTRVYIVTLPTFPRSIRLPVMGGKRVGQPLWRARDVVDWTESQIQP